MLVCHRETPLWTVLRCRALSRSFLKVTLVRLSLLWITDFRTRCLYFLFIFSQPLSDRLLNTRRLHGTQDVPGRDGL